MANDTESILCGDCRVPLEGPANPKPEDRYACPRCGKGDTVENVLAEVKAFITEAAQRLLDESLRKATWRNKFVKFESKPRPKRVYRFITDHRL